MTNDLTGLVSLIGSLTALVTAVSTLILHLRSQRNVKSQTPPQQPSSANEPYVPGTQNPPAS